MATTTPDLSVSMDDQVDSVQLAAGPVMPRRIEIRGSDPTFAGSRWGHTFANGACVIDCEDDAAFDRQMQRLASVQGVGYHVREILR